MHATRKLLMGIGKCLSVCTEYSNAQDLIKNRYARRGTFTK